MTAQRVLVLNGPNLGRLGTREPEIYGSTTYPELAALCVRAGAELGLAVEVHQSDAEAELIGWLHRAADERLPVVLNPAGLSHTSVVLRDAVAARTAPLVEVHISNIAAREEFRHHSYVSAVASGVITGLGVEGYVLALSWLSSVAATSNPTASAASNSTASAATDPATGPAPTASTDPAAGPAPSAGGSPAPSP